MIQLARQRSCDIGNTGQQTVRERPVLAMGQRRPMFLDCKQHLNP